MSCTLYCQGFPGGLHRSCSQFALALKFLVFPVSHLYSPICVSWITSKINYFPSNAYFRFESGRIQLRVSGKEITKGIVDKDKSFYKSPELEKGLTYLENNEILIVG